MGYIKEVNINKKEKAMKKIIEESGLKLKEFAKLYDIPYNTVRQWYNEERKCPQYIKSIMIQISELKSKEKQLNFLKDKLESGALVDTEEYFIIEEKQCTGKNKFLVCQNAVQLAICDFCESREEAEKQLTENKKYYKFIDKSNTT